MSPEVTSSSGWELGDAGWALVIVVAFVLVWCVVLGHRIATWKVERRVARSRAMGEAGERRALRMLRRAGYKLTALQPAGVVSALVDGELHTFPVRADALVKRRGRTFIAEIKAGPASARLEHRATRRQLLEYAHAFTADGLLLVDAHNRRIVEVAFLGPGGARAVDDARLEEEDEYEEDALEDDALEDDEDDEDDELEDDEDELEEDELEDDAREDDARALDRRRARRSA